jgi:D-alanyl-D-alanine carboxypeptidase
MLRFASLVSALFCSAAAAAPVVLSDIKGYGFDDNRQLQPFSVLVFDDESGKVIARGDAALTKKYDSSLFSIV